MGRRSNRGRAQKAPSDFNRGLRARPEAVQVWVDGSTLTNPGVAGAGAVLEADGQQLRERLYIGYGTNNEAELRAMLLGLRMASPYRDRPVDLHSDSQYAIGVGTGRYRATANQELVAELRHEMALFPDLRVLWVRGHSGHPLNELADELALQARIVSS